MLKFIKSALSSILLSITIIYGAIVAPELHNHYLRYEVGESVVQVLSMTSDGGGTGFAIKGKSGTEYIMTNRHVCELGQNGTIRVKVGNETPSYKRIIYKDSVHDLCIVEGIRGLAPISIGSNPGKGDFMYVVGHPGLRKLTTSVGEYIGNEFVDLLFNVDKREDCPGKIMDLNFIQQIFYGKDFACIRSYEALATSAVIYGGNSGSPVVNRYGNLIGVAFAGSTQQERDNYIVPLRYVISILNQF